ncbi:MAG: ABC transporter permease [Phycisphaerae bacterium]|nr:ABC transporter permease [Phycisphaerae bacterium]
MVLQEALRTPVPLPLRHHLNPVRMVRNLWSHRDLTWQLAQRDVTARYRSTYLGMLWSILNPLILLAIYTFVFSVVFQARWGDNPNESRGEFALAMFCGILVYNVFSEVLIRAPSLVIGNPVYVKKLIFPLEVFVVSGLISALINMLISLGVWLIGWVLIMQTWPPLTGLWFPLLFIPVCLLTAGLAWVVASLGVFIRDLGHAVLLVVQMLFFMTPIFYKIGRVPFPFRYVLYANPLTWAVEDMRNVLMWGGQPNWIWLSVATVTSAAVALLGYAFFMKSKRAFADVV